MSHIVKGNAEVADLTALASAATQLGGVLETGRTTYNWYGRHVGDYPPPEGFAIADLGTCDHVVKFPGIHYEVGVKRNLSTGKFALLYDFYNSSISLDRHDGLKLKAKIGDGAGLLLQRYATCHAKAQFTRRGYSVTERKLPNGTVELLASGFTS